MTVIDLVCRVINTSDYGGNYSASLCPGERSRRKSRLRSSCYASDVIALIRKQSNIQQTRGAFKVKKKKKKNNEMRIDRSLMCSLKDRTVFCPERKISERYLTSRSLKKINTRKINTQCKYCKRVRRIVVFTHGVTA